METLITEDTWYHRISAECDGIVRKMLSKNPNLRYQTREEVGTHLERLRHPRQRHQLRAGMLATTLVAGLIAGFGIYRTITAPGRPSGKAAFTVPLVTTPGSKDFAAFSPDGRQIAFSWNGGTDPVLHIYVKTIGD